ncbi:MAG TPA: UPF0489 family protein [Acidimicrobiales bacterium]|nr:UPF0489 family protein [Acidimicrobiales bacterium]
MQRVLDVDLDFFGYEVAYWPDVTVRPEPEEFPVWSQEDALDFLSEQCQLGAPLPGFLTENHGELFALWRAAVDEGVLEVPFHVTHVDAHADLGLGDNGYEYLMSEVLALPPAARSELRTDSRGLGDGNYLAFAIACRWVGSLEYVFGEGGGGDELYLHMESFDQRAAKVQLKEVSLAELQKHRLPGTWPDVIHLEPAVPYRAVRAEAFSAEAPYDFICLTRSAPYVPTTADPLYDLIRDTYMDVRYQSPESAATR